MSEEWKEEMKKLREELADMKEQLNKMRAGRERRGRGIYIDVGERVQDHIEDVMEGVAEGISGELERSVLIGPHGLRIYKGRHAEEPEEEPKVDLGRVASTMSALGNEHRLKILEELTFGGKYISELQEKLPDITSSTLSSHLKGLEDAGLVVQEKVRGRYLITIPGRIALKTAMRITKQIERSKDESLEL